MPFDTSFHTKIVFSGSSLAKLWRSEFTCSRTAPEAKPFLQCLAQVDVPRCTAFLSWEGRSRDAIQQKISGEAQLAVNCAISKTTFAVLRAGIRMNVFLVNVPEFT